MVLYGHTNAAYLNVRKLCSRVGAHIMISEDVPVPSHNGLVLTIDQIIKNFMSSAAESELTGLFTIAKERIPIRQALIEMGWPQLKTPIQCKNSTPVSMANETIIPRKTKYMDMNFHWLCCRESQRRFQFFWFTGKINLGEYITKKNPPCLTFPIGTHMRARKSI